MHYSEKDWKIGWEREEGFHLESKASGVMRQNHIHIRFPCLSPILLSLKTTTRFKTLWHRSKNPFKEWKQRRGEIRVWLFSRRKVLPLGSTFWNATYYWKWVLRCCVCQLKKGKQWQKNCSFTQQETCFQSEISSQQKI